MRWMLFIGLDGQKRAGFVLGESVHGLSPRGPQRPCARCSPAATTATRLIGEDPWAEHSYTATQVLPAFANICPTDSDRHRPAAFGRAFNPRTSQP